MPRKPKAFVLDTWSVMAYLEDEPAGQKVADLIADAHENGIALLMTVVNAGEVWYTLARELSESAADESLTALSQLGIELVDAEGERGDAAAKVRAEGGVGCGDCYAGGLAEGEKAEVVTGD